MWWYSSRVRPLSAPAAFIHPCQPIVAKQPPSGPGWAHELKHDGYRLQILVRDGRVSEKLFLLIDAVLLQHEADRACALLHIDAVPAEFMPPKVKPTFARLDIAV
jgi:hypothetical protein